MRESLGASQLPRSNSLRSTRGVFARGPFRIYPSFHARIRVALSTAPIRNRFIVALYHLFPTAVPSPRQGVAAFLTPSFDLSFIWLPTSRAIGSYLTLYYISHQLYLFEITLLVLPFTHMTLVVRLTGPCLFPCSPTLRRQTGVLDLDLLSCHRFSHVGRGSDLTCLLV